MVVANAKATAHEQCPWCGSPISHEKFVEVKERIRAEEKKQHDAIAADMKSKFDEQLRDQREKLREAQVERAKLEAKLKHDIEAAAAAAKRAAEEAAALKSATEAQRTRELLEAKHQEDLLNVKAEAAKKHDELLKKLADLEAKHGPSVEVPVDVLAELQAEFDQDRIIAVPADAGGAATIIMEVRLKNAVCGKILIDARPRKTWQSNFAGKLHEEMLEEKAEHAILATSTFPKDQNQLCEHNGVLLVHPARVREVVRLLRRLTVKMFQQRASTEQRADKKAKLYDFITSASGRQRLLESGTLAKQLLDLDVEETREHQRVWKKRGEIERKIQKLSAELVDEIDDITGGSGK